MIKKLKDQSSTNEKFNGIITVPYNPDPSASVSDKIIHAVAAGLGGEICIKNCHIVIAKLVRTQLLPIDLYLTAHNWSNRLDSSGLGFAASD